jgi:hypothetical protein
MVHHHEQRNDSTDPSSTDPSAADAPDVEPRSGPVNRRPVPGGQVEPPWLRPRFHRRVRPRASTIMLLIVWIAVLALYLELRPGG